MREKIVCTCPNNIIAQRVVGILMQEGITFRQHDENSAAHSGMYGPMPCIAIFVSEADYKKAWALVSPIVNASADCSVPVCPKCNSSDISCRHKSRYTSSVSILAIFLFLAPCVFLYFTNGTKYQSDVLYCTCLITFFSSIAIILYLYYRNKDYKCNLCGRRFNRRR